MSKKLMDLQHQRNKLIADCRSMLDEAEQAKKPFDQEQENRYNTMFNEAMNIGKDIEREQSLSGLEVETRAGINAQRTGVDISAEIGKANTVPSGGEYRFQKINLEGRENHKRAAKEYGTAFRDYFLNGEGAKVESRATLQADSLQGGGFLLAPLQLSDRFIKAVDDLLVLGAKVTRITLSGAVKFGAPELATDVGDADWTQELSTGNEDTNIVFARRELEPRPVAKRIKVSKKLIASFPGIVNFILGRLAYKHAITREKAMMTGTGVGQPLGLFTPNALGIPTSRDMATDNTSSAVKFDNLIRNKYNVKQQYHTNSGWLFHRDIVNQISREKDTTNQYLWQPSTQLGQPDRLLSFPVLMSEFAPNTVSTGAYVGLFGDLSQYWLVDTENLEIQVLAELYALTNQNGYISRAECDGAPVLPEAFSRIKLG